MFDNGDGSWRKAVEGEDYEMALSLMPPVDDKSSIDQKWLYARLLIKSGDIEKAAKVLAAFKLGDSFESAYCAYRLRLHRKCLRILTGLQPSDPKVLALRGQLLYRAGKYRDALDCFAQLRRSDGGDEQILCNLLACRACIHDDIPELPAETITERSAYDVLYNRACELLSHDATDDAILLLKAALAQCRKTFQDDPQTLAHEQAFIECQLAIACKDEGVYSKTSLRNPHVKLLKQPSCHLPELTIEQRRVTLQNMLVGSWRLGHYRDCARAGRKAMRWGIELDEPWRLLYLLACSKTSMYRKGLTAEERAAIAPLRRLIHKKQ